MDQALRDKMCARMREVQTQVAERDELIEVIAIALLTRKNVFVLGDTGQAKSAVINLFRDGLTGANVIQFEEYTSTLTPLQQRIAELRDIGYSDREISAICGIPYKVVALEMEGAKRSILEVYIGDAPRAA